MVLRQAFRGRARGNSFWGCANYPTCKGIVSLDGKESKAETPVDTVLTALATRTPCPNCGKPMTIRMARKGPNAGKPFLGCTGYPKCKTAVTIAEAEVAATIPA